MINAKNFFDLAQLAEASYALFNISSPGDALNAIEFSQAQATELANHWLIVPNRHQPNTGSGFSSTLFQSKDAGGGYVLAFRGTEGNPIANGLPAFTDDLLRADIGDIVIDGIAIDQTVDLYNEWQRIKTTGAYNAAKLVTLDTETNLLKAAYSLSIVAGLAYEAVLRARTDIIIDNPSHLVRTIQFESSATLFSDTLRKTGLGLGADIAAKGLTVTGHSLGGHLADVFTRLFSDVKADAVTVNGAGFATGVLSGLSGNAAFNISNLFSLLGGASAFDSSKILNIYGDKNPEIVTMNGPFLFQQGGHQAIFIEQSTFFGNTAGHGAGQLTDSLAVYDLFIELDASLQSATPQAALAKLKPLFETGSNKVAQTLESLVNALGDLFKAGTKITEAETDKRDPLYARINAIKNSALYQQVTGLVTIRDLSIFSANQIDLVAQGNLAYRYALKALNPFAVVGDDSLYAQHNANGELDLYDASTGTGNLSKAYLTDRAAFLSWKIQLNLQDRTDSLVPYFGLEQAHFKDEASNLEIYAGNPISVKSDPAVRKILFGGNGADTITGGSANDKLYGGKDSDRLEGSLGLDTYSKIVIGGLTFANICAVNDTTERQVA